MTYTPLIREQYRMSKEPTGFPNQTDSTISFDNGTRTFSIAPVGATFDFFVAGVRYIKSTTQTATITNTEGLWYFYFDASGVLQSTNVFVPEIITQYAYVSLVYWDSTNLQAIYFGEERHGLTMDGVTHSYLHNSVGAVYLSGLALDDFDINGTGNLATNAQLSCADGSFYDEDIRNTATNGSPQTLAPTAQIPIYYRNSSGTWRRKAADTYPVIYSGTAGYTGANGRLPYNQDLGVNWVLTEVGNLNFVLVHYFATNDKNSPIVGVQGITEYLNLNDARAGASTEIATASGLPFSEFIPIGSVIFQTSAGYGNVPKARIRTTDTGDNYVDFRTTINLPLGSVTSHANLSGLTNPDHPASAIFTSTTNFNNILSAANTTVQSALDTLDNIIPLTDGDKGDITVASSGTSWTIDAAVVSNSKLANVATATFKGRTTAGTGSPEDLTTAQATALLDVFSSTLKGLAPASGGGTANYLRADGTWAAPPGAGLTDGDKGDITVSASGATWTIDAAVVSNSKLADVATATFKGRTTAGTGSPEDLTGTQATALLDAFTSTLKGLAPASGGGTANYLRADGTWAAPPGSFTQAAADLLYLKLDTSNGPLTNTLSINKATPSIAAPTLTTPSAVDFYLSAASGAGGRGLFISSSTATSADNGVTIFGSPAATTGRTSVLVSTTVSTAADRYAFRVTNATGDIIRLNGLSQTLVADGVVANPSISFINSVGTGLYRPAADQIGFANAGVQSLLLTGSAATFAVSISASNLSGTNTGDQTITLTSDVTGSGTGSFATTIAAGVVSNSKLANVATATFKGRTTAGTGSPEDLTTAQATALLDAFTSTLKGLAPASGGGTANYLRADGTWATPPGTFSQAAADLLYLKLDTSNGPLTNTLTINKTTPSASAPTLTTPSAVDLWLSAASNAGSRSIFVSSGAATTTDNGITITGAGVTTAGHTSVLISTPIAATVDLYALRVTNGTGDILQLNGLSQALVAAGTASSPAFSFIGDTNTGIFRDVADQIAFSTNGIERLRITTTAATFAVPVSATNLSGTNTGDQTITLTSDVTGSGTGSFATTIAAGVVSNSKLANVATATIKGRTTAGTGSPEDLTGTQATALLDAFTSTLKGLAPASGGGTTNFLRADGTWAAPPGSGGGVTDGDKGDITVSGTGTVWTIDATVVTNAKLANVATATFKGRTTAGTGSPEDLTGTQATALLDVFSSTLKGLAPASGGGTANFLRADGTWAAPTVSGTFADGSAAAPSINFTSDTDTGFYWNGSSGDIGVTSNGLRVFVIGNAGINANNFGGVLIRPNANNTAAAPAYAFHGSVGAGSNDMGMYRPAADTLAFSTAATERLSISTAVIATTLDLAVGVATANERATVEGRLSLRETTAPTATANYGKVYAKTADAQLYFMDDTGQEYKLSGVRRVVGLVIDGAGSAISTGVKQYIRIPTGLNGVVTKWTLLADQVGSIVIDVWKDTFANYPPTVADTITGSAKPTLSSAISAESSVLTGWTTTVTAGDVIAFKVDSAATVTKVTLELEVLT